MCGHPQESVGLRSDILILVHMFYLEEGDQIIFLGRMDQKGES